MKRKFDWHRCSDGSYVLKRPYRWVTHEGSHQWVVRKKGRAVHTLSGDWNAVSTHRTLREAKRAAEREDWR